MQPLVPHANPKSNRKVCSRTTEFLQQLEDWLEMPMLVLGFTWLALLVIELIWGLTPARSRRYRIWIIFILDSLCDSPQPHKLNAP